MTEWHEAPSEVRRLLNPAFIAVIVARVAAAYQEDRNAAIPFGLVFIAIPAVLHKPTRDLMPRDTRTRMTTWMQRHPQVRSGFGERARELVPFIRAGLTFGLTASALRITPTGDVEAGSAISTSRALDALAPTGTADDANECLRRATFVGRWLSQAGSASTVFAIWGVRP